MRNNVYLEYTFQDENELFGEVIPRLQSEEEILNFIIKYYKSSFKRGKVRNLPKYSGLSLNHIIHYLQEDGVIKYDLMKQNKIINDYLTYNILNMLLSVYWEETTKSLIDIFINKSNCKRILEYIDIHEEYTVNLYNKKEFVEMYEYFIKMCEPKSFLNILDTYNGNKIDKETEYGKSLFKVSLNRTNIKCEKLYKILEDNPKRKLKYKKGGHKQLMHG